MRNDAEYERNRSDNKMFVKPFKTKSNTQVKSTERKKIRTKIESAFKVSEDELNVVFGSKVMMSQVKLIASNGRTVSVYTCDKRPMFFEWSDEENQLNSVIVPTVYALWLLPDLVPMFTTHAAVLPRLASGADLMLPGECRLQPIQSKTIETFFSFSIIFRCHPSR